MIELARYGHLVAYRSDDGVVIDGRSEPVEVRRGDRLTLTWGGMAAAVGMTPIDLDLVSGGRTHYLIQMQILDEDEGRDWRVEIDAVRAFAESVASAAGASFVEER